MKRAYPERLKVGALAAPPRVSFFPGTRIFRVGCMCGQFPARSLNLENSGRLEVYLMNYDFRRARSIPRFTLAM
jgi:hypothetical protein